MRIFLSMAVAGLSVLGMGCGGASMEGIAPDASTVDSGVTPPACTAAAALQVVTTDSGAYQIYVCGTASPARGTNDFTFLVTDTSGAPQPTLTLAVQPWMPYMGHGSPAAPSVANVGEGLYEVSNCVFQMAGTWQLRTSIAGPTSDGADPQFQIN